MFHRAFSALILSAALAGCATQGTSAMGDQPNTQTTVFAKDTVGDILSGGNVQWVTMAQKSACAYGKATAGCIAEDQRHCFVAENAFAIPTYVPAISGAVSGAVVLAASVTTGGAWVGFPGKVLGDNAKFDGVIGAGQYGLNGHQYGVLDRLRYDEKCADGKASAGGYVHLDSRFASPSSPSVIALRADGTVAPIHGGFATADEPPLVDTSVIPAGRNRDIYDGCLKGLHQLDPTAFDKLNACLRAHNSPYAAVPIASNATGLSDQQPPARNKKRWH